MQLSGTQKLCNTLHVALALAAITFSLAVSARAQTETVLYSFANGPGGYAPQDGVTFDAAGNLFGTTSEGGNFTACSTGCGVVFELSPIAGGGWSESVPHTFGGGGDGKNPFAGLISDAAGNFYGATGLGHDTIFELSPIAGGGWSKTVLHYFSDPSGGTGPYANLVFDSAGNLYGTAHNGGNVDCNCGVVFELSPTGTGWKETVLHTFTGENGAYPSGSLIFDSAGNLYGTASYGGTGCTYANCGSGLVFKLSPSSGGGRWTETPIFEFTNHFYGWRPVAGLIFDSAGNLYGTTSYGGNLGECGGNDGCGLVFELSPNSTGGWGETEVDLFGGSDGALPQAGFVADGAGNFYSTTSLGGPSNCGVVFKLTPTSGGFSVSTTYTFTCLADGGYPTGDLVLDASGNLYGTGQYGGANGVGVVYEITP
jgi:uncharacterized repeat protein (TIGR03803 family)